MMHLKVICLTTLLVDQPVQKVLAEGGHGFFCLLPQHIDTVMPLLAGIFSFETVTGEETFLAIDEGILVKQGTEIWVAVKNAVQGNNLELLQQAVHQQFETLNEQEEKARSMLARLESSIVREFIDVGGML